MTEEGRLTRIEKKLDEMATVLSNVVRLEEMIIALSKRADRLEYRLDLQENSFNHLKDRIGHTREALSTANSGLKFVERISWIVIGTCASILVWMAKG